MTKSSGVVLINIYEYSLNKRIIAIRLGDKEGIKSNEGEEDNHNYFKA